MSETDDAEPRSRAAEAKRGEERYPATTHRAGIRRCGARIKPAGERERDSADGSGDEHDQRLQARPIWRDKAGDRTPGSLPRHDRPRSNTRVLRAGRGVERQAPGEEEPAAPNRPSRWKKNSQKIFHRAAARLKTDRKRGISAQNETGPKNGFPVLTCPENAFHPIKSRIP